MESRIFNDGNPDWLTGEGRMKIKQMKRMLRARPPGWWVVCVSNIWCMHCGPCMCVAEANFSPVEFCPWEGGGTGLNPEVRQWTPKVPRFLHRARSFTSPHIMLINTLPTHCNYSCIRRKPAPERWCSLLFPCHSDKTEIWIHIWFHFKGFSTLSVMLVVLKLFRCQRNWKVCTFSVLYRSLWKDW